MQDLKKFTGLHCNRYLGREGSFWEEESYEHIVRSELEFYRILNYILRNPIKAKFVKEWQRWPFTFAKPELLCRLRNAVPQLYCGTPFRNQSNLTETAFRCTVVLQNAVATKKTLPEQRSGVW